MLQVTSSVDAFTDQRRQTLYNGGQVNKVQFIGPWEKPKVPNFSQPQAYLIMQDPGTVIDAHYHQVEQWQVIMSGSGLLGRNAAGPVMLHYTDRYTAYGPIKAGENGIAYFSIRAMSDPTAQYLHLPGVRETLLKSPRSKKRFILVKSENLGMSAANELAGRKEPAIDVIVELMDDGVGAWIVRLGSAQSIACPDPAASGGQNVVVLTGCLVHNGRKLPEKSCIFSSQDENALTLSADECGAECLVLQFPRPELAGMP